VQTLSTESGPEGLESWGQYANRDIVCLLNDPVCTVGNAGLVKGSGGGGIDTPKAHHGHLSCRCRDCPWVRGGPLVRFVTSVELIRPGDNSRIGFL